MMQRSIWNGVRRLRDPSLYDRAHLHSTPCTFAKRSGKVPHYSKVEGKSKPSPKNCIRFSVRHKRADAKRALNDFLLNGSYIKKNVQEEWETWYGCSKRGQHVEIQDFSSDFHDNSRSDNPRGCKGNRASPKKTKRNGKISKKWKFVSDDEETDFDFEAKIGGKYYRWSCRSGTDFQSQDRTRDFKESDRSYDSSDSWKCWNGTGEQRENSSAENDRNRKGWESESDFDSEDEYAETKVIIGLSSHRVVLGLPPTGPLKMGDVKTAFRVSALKWHPDKHQGPSKVMAGEKFKLCLEAYQSLCSTLASI